MATLSGNKIKNTYQSLVKFSDNGNITVGAKQLTDGFGNNSPMFVSTTQVGIGVTPEAGLNLHVFGDAKIGSNLTVIGNLVVEGSTTTVGTDTLTVKDPLIVLANNNTSTDAVDIGFYGKYHPSDTTLYSGLFREALTGKYRLFKGLEVEPTTTVNTSGTGYAVATLIANLEGNVTGNLLGNVSGTLTGNVIGGSISGTTGTFSGNVDIDGQLDVDDVISVEGSAFGRIEIGGASGGYIDLKAPNSDDYDFRIITSSGGNEITTATGDLIFNTAETLALTIDTSQDATFEGDIILAGTVDGRDVATDGAKLDGIEAGADVTDATNVLAAGAVMTTGNQSIAGEKTFSDDFTVTSDAVFNGNINLDDDERIRLGTSNAFQLYYDSTLASGQGGAVIDSNRIFIETNFFQLNSRTGENMIKATSDGDVELYYNDSKKLETTNTGVDVTGNIDFTGNINIGDNQKILFGDSGDVEMFFNGSTFVIDDTVEVFGFDIDTNLIRFRGTDLYTEISNTQHTFWTSGVERLKINSTEVKVSRPLNVVGDLTVDTDTLFVDVSTDSVGINTSNPSDYRMDELVVTVPDEGGITIASATDEAAYLAFADVTGLPLHYLRVDHSLDKFELHSEGSFSFQIQEGVEALGISSTSVDIRESTTIHDSLTVDGNATFAGKLGVGITPVAKFQVSGDSGGADSIARFQNTNSAKVTKLQLLDSAGAVGDALIAYDHSDASSANHFLGMGVNNSTTLVINNSDNVGIGTTSPRSITNHTSLTINGTSVGRVDLSYGGTISASLYSNNSSTGLQTESALPLVLGTNATERMRIDSSGNVRFTGTAPNSGDEITQLNFYNTSSSLNLARITGIRQAGGQNYGALTFSTTNSGTLGERMRITSGGLIQASAGGGGFRVVSDAANPSNLIEYYYSSSFNHGLEVEGDRGLRMYSNTGDNSGKLTFYTEGSERMRITSGGAIQVGYIGTLNGFGAEDVSGLYYSGGNSGGYVAINSNSTNAPLYLSRSSSSATGVIINFASNTTSVGSISVTATATAYNTSSDYRLKENVVSMTDALDRVSQLKPSRFNFIADANKTVDGFLAHEVQEIVPEAITGEKDAMIDEEYEVSPDVYEDVIHPAEEAVYETVEHPAVEEELDDEGNVVVEAVEAYTEEVLVTEAKEEWTEKVLVTEKVMGTREVPDYQGIDQSKLVPLLVGAIQELKAEIESLKLQINN